MSIAKRLNYSRGGRTTAGAVAAMNVEGDLKLVRLLDEIVSESGAKSVNAAMRKATRRVCREVLLPKVRDLIPVDSGFLEDSLTVRAAGKRGSRVGHSVGFRDPLFRGDTFYGGFIEFGFTHRNAGNIQADSFLRRPLYEHETEVRRFVRDELRDFIRSTNRAAPDRL